MTFWDVSTAVHVREFGVGGREAGPTGLFFNPTGTKMYIVGASGVEVNEYNLSTAWNISTAVWSQLFDVSGEEALPTELFFNPTGTVMFVVGNDGVEVNQYALSPGWDISTAVYARVFSVAGEETDPAGICFNDNGTKMYIVGDGGVEEVNEYDLTIGWNLLMTAHVQALSLAGQEAYPKGIFFKSDGSKMYITGAEGDDVNEYNLSTPWNISSAILSQTFSVAGEETAPAAIFFKPDGSRMYILGTTGVDVTEYGLPIGGGGAGSSMMSKLIAAGLI